ncbi:trypsin-1-like [Condylostylus longicornis]|uniref:trypsin-1-like n=1 Tax=Condylostylus longicornis TaxID=2530218 RepID=UPI00244E090C|nr:trypsin-1-like [Condylostylus longicornis]
MLRYTIFLIVGFITIIRGYDLPKPFLDGRIVGGVQVNISEIPYQISLQYYNRHICGGSLIAKNLVLTAAHCTDGSSPSSLSVRIGSSKHASGGILVQVENIHQHPNFSYSTIDWDFSVLRLSNYSNQNLTIGIAKLPKQNEKVPDGTIVRASGWGNTQNPQESNSNLRAVQLPIVNQDQCNKAYKAYGGVTPRMICAGLKEGGKDSCQGDSGGPLVLNNTLIGVVSWGYGCAVAGYPGVYARVPAVRDWIRQVSGV